MSHIKLHLGTFDVMVSCIACFTNLFHSHRGREIDMLAQVKLKSNAFYTLHEQFHRWIKDFEKGGPTFKKRNILSITHAGGGGGRTKRIDICQSWAQNVSRSRDNHIMNYCI